MIVDQAAGVHFNELVEIQLLTAASVRSQILEVQEDKAMVSLRKVLAESIWKKPRSTPVVR